METIAGLPCRLARYRCSTCRFWLDAFTLAWVVPGTTALQPHCRALLLRLLPPYPLRFAADVPLACGCMVVPRWLDRSGARGPDAQLRLLPTVKTAPYLTPTCLGWFAGKRTPTVLPPRFLLLIRCLFCRYRFYSYYLCGSMVFRRDRLLVLDWLKHARMLRFRLHMVAVTRWFAPHLYITTPYVLVQP